MTVVALFYVACYRCKQPRDTGPDGPVLSTSAEEALRDALATPHYTDYKGHLLCGLCVELAQADALATHGVYDDNREDIAMLPKPVLVEIFGEDRAAQIAASGDDDTLVYVQRESP